MLETIFKKNIFHNNDNNKTIKSNKFIKKGLAEEKEINLIYNLATAKKSPKYLIKLSDILFISKKIDYYPYKRINLEKAIYIINKNQELLVTLPKFLLKCKVKNNTTDLKNTKTKSRKSSEKSENKIIKNNSMKTVINCNYNKNKIFTFEKEEIKLEKLKTNIFTGLNNKYYFGDTEKNFNSACSSLSSKRLFPKIKLNLKKISSFINSKKTNAKSRNDIKSGLNKDNGKDDLINEIKHINRKMIELNKSKQSQKINTPIYYISKLNKKHPLQKELTNSNKESYNIKNKRILKKMKSELMELKSKYKLELEI